MKIYFDDYYFLLSDALIALLSGRSKKVITLHWKRALGKKRNNNRAVLRWWLNAEERPTEAEGWIVLVLSFQFLVSRYKS